MSLPGPEITCAVPTLNSALTLDHTLLALRSQRGVRTTIVVVDSGSTDGTTGILERWSLGSRYTPPGNLYAAVNAGLADAATSWVTYLNSDDLVYADSYARLIARGEETGADVVYGNCDYCDVAGRFVFSFSAAPPPALLPLFRLGRMGFAQPAAIFRRDAYQRLSGFDTAYRFKADADFFLRALEAGLRFAYCDGPAVACFRLHGSQLSNTGGTPIAEEGRRLYGRLAGARPWGDRMTLAGWTLRNTPHYLIRIVRESLLSGRLRLPRSQEGYDHR